MVLTTNNIKTVLSNAKRTIISQNDEAIINKRKGLPFCCTKYKCAQAIISALEDAKINETPSSISFTLRDMGAFEGTKFFELFITPAGASTAYYTLGFLSLSTGADNAAALVTLINNNFPDTFPFYATAVGNVVTVYGTNIETDNGLKWTLKNPQANGLIAVSTLTMQGGEFVSFNENCITNEEAKSIFEKLNQLVSPCEPLDETTN